MKNELDFIENQDKPQANILIVDDVDDNLEILGSLLTFDGYEVQTARNGEDALKQVQDTHPDLILMDVLMPGMSGFELCERLKSRESTKDIPVIFVSSMSDIDSKVNGFKVGGVDYINKPYQHAEIVVRVNTQLTMMRMRQHLEKQNAELERLANTDYLTNLYNRRSFFHAAESEYAESIRSGTPLSISLIDLDYFKQVNDTYGHLVGDQVLVHIAKLIRMYSRIRDVAARYGGEEFTILHPSIDKQNAFLIIDRIRKGVEETPFVLDGKQIDVTLSAGVVDTLMCTGCTRIDDVLRMADKALYHAKDTGRNQVVVFDGQETTHLQS
ncbi:MAG: diguanylate cyclase [Anaerolineales bacterium]|jgi:diguanylate cyclase (GGDEF)-like protein